MKSDIYILIEVLQDTELSYIADKLKNALEKRDRDEINFHNSILDSITDNYGSDS